MSDDDNVIRPNFAGIEDPEPTAEQMKAMAMTELEFLQKGPEQLYRLLLRLGRWQRLVELDAPPVIVANERVLIRKAIPQAMAYLAGLVAFEFGIKDINTGEMIGDSE